MEGYYCCMLSRKQAWCMNQWVNKHIAVSKACTFSAVVATSYSILKPNMKKSNAAPYCVYCLEIYMTAWIGLLAQIIGSMDVARI